MCQQCPHSHYDHRRLISGALCPLFHSAHIANRIPVHRGRSGTAVTSDPPVRNSDTRRGAPSAHRTEQVCACRAMRTTQLSARLADDGRDPVYPSLPLMPQRLTPTQPSPPHSVHPELTSPTCSAHPTRSCTPRPLIPLEFPPCCRVYVHKVCVVE